MAQRSKFGEAESEQRILGTARVTRALVPLLKQVNMREWRNRQTRTFEGRVGQLVRVQVPSLAPKLSSLKAAELFFCLLKENAQRDLKPKRVKSVKKTIRWTVFSFEIRSRVPNAKHWVDEDAGFAKQSRVPSLAPDQKNPTLFPIGKGFGFFVYI